MICHGIPDSYELKDGDIVNIDITCYYEGYHGDCSETCAAPRLPKTGPRMATHLEHRVLLTRRPQLALSRLDCRISLLAAVSWWVRWMMRARSSSR